MDSCRSAIRAVGLVLGAWGFVSSLFLSFFLTFRKDAWQMFGNLMLPLIILLTLNLLACLSWIFGLAIYKTRFMFISVLYWIVPLLLSIRFIWNRARRDDFYTGGNMHYFNTEEDSLAVRFEMTMPKPYFVTIYSMIFIVLYVFAVAIYIFMFFTRKTHINDMRFNVQSVFLDPSTNLKKIRLAKP